MRTTMGQLLVNEALPEDLRDYSRVMDKPTTRKVLREVAQKYPDQYRKVSHDLLRAGQSSVQSTGFSFSLRDFMPTEEKHKRATRVRAQVEKIIDDASIPDSKKKELINRIQIKESDKLADAILDAGIKNNSRLAQIIRGGSKGNPSQYNTVAGLPLAFVDYQDNPIPIPIFNSVSEGLDPVEYWASSYGTRKGIIATKFATQGAGYFSKQLALAAQRGVVTEDDCGTVNGIEVDGDDRDNTGTVLQTNVGNLKAGTVIQPEHVKKLKGKSVVVRSPLTCECDDGVCGRCVGIRETGNFPEIGDNVGISVAQALGEQFSQMMLNTKHVGGALGSGPAYSFADVEKLFQMPEGYTDFVPVARADGKVTSIEDAPQGGVFVNMGDDEQYWVQSRDIVSVKPGQVIEEGDLIADGVPNFKDYAAHRGIGDARMGFMQYLKKMGGKVSRRNAEIMARFMISHVQTSDRDEDSGTLPGDVVRYDSLARRYRAREDAAMTPVASARGMYLEQPLLHYTIGTKVNNRVLSDLKKKGVTSILAHKEAPRFTPDVQRLFVHPMKDQDWMARMSGFNLKTGFLESVHTGGTSDEHSTSFVPALAQGTQFGDELRETGKY